MLHIFFNVHILYINKKLDKLVDELLKSLLAVHCALSIIFRKSQDIKCMAFTSTVKTALWIRQEEHSFILHYRADKPTFPGDSKQDNYNTNTHHRPQHTP